VEKPFVDVEGLSKDTAMIQSVNRLTFRDPAVWEAMSQRRTVFVSTNRGMAVAWVDSQAKKHGWPTVAGLEGVSTSIPSPYYACLFGILFRNSPADALLHSTYPLVVDHGGRTMNHSFSAIWEIVSTSYTVAVHWRQPDALARKNQTCPLTAEHLGSIEEIALRHKPPTKQGGQSVLVLSTNSQITQRQILQHFEGSSLFDHVVVQALFSEIHVNPGEWGGARAKTRTADDESNFKTTLLNSEAQTLRDWWLLHAADVLIADFRSGFSTIAALTTAHDQHLYMPNNGEFVWEGKNGRGCALSGGNAATNPIDRHTNSVLCAYGRLC